jgi:hypothetical protein
LTAGWLALLAGSGALGVQAGGRRGGPVEQGTAPAEQAGATMAEVVQAIARVTGIDLYSRP